MKPRGPDTTTSPDHHGERTRTRSGQVPQQRVVDPKTGRLYRIVRSVSSPAGPSAERPEPPRSFSPPPPALRKAHFDNLAIVPASLLPEKAEWQALANALPAGSTLIVLPDKPGAARAALEQVSRSLSAHGSRVTTIEQDERLPRGLRQEIVAP